MLARLSRIALFLLLGCAFPNNGIAATSAYVQTTEGLDLNRVQFIVSAPPEFTSRLSRQARSLIAKAGLPLHDSEDQDRPLIATLTLTLDPQPLGNDCPGHILYTPSLTLTEPVLISRNSVIMDNITWLAHARAQVRTSVTITDIEHDLEEFMHQFITDYRAANAASRSSIPSSLSTVPHPEASHPAITPTAPEALHRDSTLKALRIDQLQLSVSAGRFSRELTAQALQQFRNAGLALSRDQPHNDQLTLGVELTQQSLEDHCPGKILYESGLYLVEPIQLTRNPRVSIWSDTWLRETTQVVAPRSQEQLESDQDTLLRQFINSLKTH
ncbi:exported hypothetical protein [Nitrospira lenta]|uniref:Lipoprotein n=2 Tax=Nitrospira lenta TaxID=1436998 RepID=A0A330L303_9BACT|nr:exported hypothetical protein [Nitrospira lenta]